MTSTAHALVVKEGLNPDKIFPLDVGQVLMGTGLNSDPVATSLNARTLLTTAMSGCILQYVTTTTLQITEGQIVANNLSETTPFLLNLTGNLSINYAIVGPGGLQAGSIAENTSYANFVIGDTTGVNPPQGFASTSAAPTLPSGYNVFAPVGSTRTLIGAATLRQFKQIGINQSRQIIWADGSTDSLVLNAQSSTTSDTLISTVAAQPSLLNSGKVCGYYIWTPSASGNTFTLGAKGASGKMELGGGAMGETYQGFFECDTALLSQLGYSVAEADDVLSLWITGYYENLH